MSLEQVRVALSARVYDNQVGGNTRYVREVYSRINSYGIDFDLLRVGASVDNASIRSGLYAGFESILWPISARAKADVLHFPADTGAVINAKTPIVGTIHGLATLHMSNVRNSAADALWKLRVRRLANVSDQIITVSESSADDIAFFEPQAQDRIVVIHHGIDHEKFNTKLGMDFEHLRSELSLPDQYFLYLGNLDPRKNIIELAAAASLTYKVTGIPLVVCGSPAWDSGEILRALTNSDGVLYLGRAREEHLVPLMQNALAFCFPSSYEGFGFPVLEAMATGTPVICSDRGSLAEVVLDSAYVIRDIDHKAISEAMIDVANSPSMRNDLSVKGLANVQRFHWPDSARKHADVFRSVAK